jgi:MFS family permease
MVGLLLSVRAGATMASRLMMDTTLRILGWQRAMIACLAISAVTLALIPATAFPAALIAIMVVLGLSIGILQPMTVTWIASRAAKGERGTALAVRLTGNRGSLLLVPAVMGAVAGSAGVAAVFWILAGVIGLGSVIGRQAHTSNPAEAGSVAPEAETAKTPAKA